MNDREMLLQRQEDQQAETHALAAAQQYEELGIGLAAFCLAMYAALMVDQAFTREEALRLVGAAVHGR